MEQGPAGGGGEDAPEQALAGGNVADVVEHALAGGNVADAVVRVGDPVRKPAGYWTPYVEGLLAHLEAREFGGAPRALGRDERGRQVLEYVPGTLAMEAPPLDSAGLYRVGRLIRDLHDASADFSPPPGARWNVAIPPGRRELVCHHDLAPWNLVPGADRWVFIDWDGAGPGSRLRDLAYAAKGFVPLEDGGDPAGGGLRLRVLADGYGLSGPGLAVCGGGRGKAQCSRGDGDVPGHRRHAGMWERLEKGEIRRRRARSARVAARRGITVPEAGDRPRPDLPEGTDLLPQIRHIVVLMMENHSYDNYLGMLAGRGEGLPLGPGGTPDAVSYTPDGKGFRAHHMPATSQVKNNPSQNWHASHIAFAGGRNDGFATAVARALPGADPAVPMGYWTEDDLPFYYGLARTFPLCDRWFSSCLGPTFPNRRFLISGTAHGLIDDLPWDIVDYPENGTILDVLTGHGIDWVNYHNVRHYSVLARRTLGGRGLTAVRRLAQAGRWLPGVADRAVGNKSFTADLYPLGLASCVRHLRRTERFFADADAGTLPAVSIVDPDFEVYSEENPQDIARGESFAAEVISRVMAGPAWPHTLLIWLYDEHGGYYDHVPPPAAVPPDDVPGHNYILDLPRWLRTLLSPVFSGGFARLKAIDEGPRDYARYGFRVPAVIVSPYARRDYVCSTTFDHTSVLKLIEEKWNLPPLTRRDAAAVAPLEALDLDAEPAFAKPAQLPEPALRWGSWGRGS